jgi:hypothetical protein
MAIWQFRLILIPEEVLSRKFGGVLPSALSMQVAEDFSWWSEIQPDPAFERLIDSLLPPTESWSTSMRIWGHEDSDDAYVCYADERKNKVEEVAFRVDARKISQEFVRRICMIAGDLGCVLLTADYEILLPEEAMVLEAIGQSTAKKFVDDPASTLRELDQSRIQRRVSYLTNDRGTGDSPRNK